MSIGWVAGNRARIEFSEAQAHDRGGSGRGRWVPANDVRLHITVHGPADGRVLVLVAGTGAWGRTWVSNLAAMTGAGWRVVTIDLPPFGYSSRPESRDYSRDAQARRLLMAIASLGCNPVVLLGHSYGGGPAAGAAMIELQRIRHLILGDAAIGMQPPGVTPCDCRSLLSEVFNQRALRTALVASTGTQPLLTPTLLKQFVHRKEVVTPQRSVIYVQPLKVLGTSEAIGDWAHQFATDCSRALSQSVQGFASLKTPLTLLWGDQDTITPLQQARDVAAAAAGAKLVVLPGVGHIPQIEHRGAFDIALAEVLNTLR